MENDAPFRFEDLRNEIAFNAWQLWNPVRPLPDVPEEFYQIAEMSIKSVHNNIDRVINDVVKQRLEDLI
jgi:hypothetical protein